MKQTDFKRFRERLIKEQFNGDLMMCGALWLTLTNKQIEILKEDVKRHAVDYTLYADGTDRVKVGCYILG